MTWTKVCMDKKRKMILKKLKYCTQRSTNTEWLFRFVIASVSDSTKGQGNSHEFPQRKRLTQGPTRKIYKRILIWNASKPICEGVKPLRENWLKNSNKNIERSLLKWLALLGQPFSPSPSVTFSSLRGPPPVTFVLSAGPLNPKGTHTLSMPVHRKPCSVTKKTKNGTLLQMSWFTFQFTLFRILVSEC